MKKVALLLAAVAFVALGLSGCGSNNNGNNAAVPTTYGTTGYGGYGTTGYPGGYGYPGGGYGAGYAAAYPGMYPGAYPGIGYGYGGGQPCDTYMGNSCQIPGLVCVPSFGSRIGICQPLPYAH